MAQFRKTGGFYRFLPSKSGIRPLSGNDLEIVLHFTRKFGPVAGASKVYFNEKAQIVVTEGPLLGLEGKVIKVDKRKGRAKVQLDLFNASFTIDLAFEAIESARVKQ